MFHIENFLTFHGLANFVSALLIGEIFLKPVVKRWIDSLPEPKTSTKEKEIV